MRKILLVNDDGYKSAGIRSLYKQLKKEHDVIAVAPETQQSWKGKSISGHSPIEVREASFHGYQGYSVKGSPADCTQLGMFELFGGLKPDAVVSGLNDGANIGHAHILSSGTVGAALEAALQGLPAFASSVWGIKNKYHDLDFESEEAEKVFEQAARITDTIVSKIMDSGFPLNVQVICINIPFNANEHSKIVVTKPHKKVYGKLFERSENGSYVNVGNTELKETDETDSDLYALSQGNVSVIPISIELTSEIARTNLATILGATVAS